jgi:3-oxoacyl-[acyl-carrier-protein] synthase II
MGAYRRDVWITGVGIVSPLGEGNEAHGAAIGTLPSGINLSDWAPYAYFPVPPIEFDKQIPKKSDQRQMALCQRIGTYAAGLALQDAGLAGDKAHLADMDIMTTTLGGERDIQVDDHILQSAVGSSEPAAVVNQKLMSELRPTFFLGQMPNLLASNIAIVHGVTGSARTLLGDELAGVDVVRLSAERIASGQSERVLAGASYNGSRKDTLLYLVCAGHAHTGPWRPVFEAEAGGGIALSSVGAFLVLEAADAAEARGARPIARLATVVADAAAAGEQTAREESLDTLLSRIKPGLDASHAAVISGASGAEPATSIERRVLHRLRLPVRSTGSHLGHAAQAQFPLNVAIAALQLKERQLFAPSCAFEADVPASWTPQQVLVTAVGRNYGEGLALLEAVGSR